MFLCLFSSGLTEYDIDLLQNRNKIGIKDWHQAIQGLIMKDEKMNEMLQSNSEMNETNYECLITLDRLKKEKFIPNNYFWMSIDKFINNNTDKTIYSFLPNQSVVKFFQNHSQKQRLFDGYQKLEYMTHLSILIIQRTKQIGEYHEKMGEMSSFCSYGLWSGKINECCQQFNFEIFTETFVASLDTTTLKKLLIYHELNFISCIDCSFIEELMENDGKYQLNVYYNN